jgi:hypothetical protein
MEYHGEKKKKKFHGIPGSSMEFHLDSKVP